MHWLIQEGRFADPGAVQRLIYAVAEAGGQVHVLRYRRDEPPALDFLPTDEPVLAFGAIGMIRDLQARRLPFAPLAWFDWDKLCCRCYYAHLGPFLLARRYTFVPFAELPRLADFLFDALGEDERVFVRPDENGKSFTGQVVSRQHFPGWHALLADDTAPEALCVVSAPESIATEWRFLVVDGRAVTGSQYRDAGGIAVKPTYPSEAAAFAERVAATWTPHPVLCVDVARTGSGEYRLVEIGSANAAGFYQCDLHAAVAAINAVAEREWQRATATPAGSPGR